MSAYFRLIGLTDFVQSEESLEKIIQYSIKQGDVVRGYYGLPYINQKFGEVKVILRTGNSDEENQLVITGVDVHVEGGTIWQLMCSDIALTKRDADLLERSVLCRKPETGTGMIPVNIMNADVIPGYFENQVIELQVVGFAEDINYYESREEADDFFFQNDTERRLTLSPGFIYPTGFMNNHRQEEQEVELYDDSMILLLARVKEVTYGEVDLGEYEDHRMFVKSVVETEMGDLVVVHSLDQIPQIQRDMMKEDSYIIALLTLSGDAAVGKYKDGTAHDKEDAISLLCSICCGEAPERLRTILDEGATFYMDGEDTIYRGRDDVITALKNLQSQRDNSSSAHIVTFTEKEDDEEAAALRTERKCVLLSCKNRDDEFVLMCDCNDHGDITDIRISHANLYTFMENNQTKAQSTYVKEAYDKETEWRFGVAGNIVRNHLDENGVQRSGTKAFSGGTKVYIDGKNWDGNANRIAVIGKNRFGRYIIETLPIVLIENVRPQRIFKPAILRVLDNEDIVDGWHWWGRTAADRKEAKAFAEMLQAVQDCNEEEPIHAKETNVISADTEHPDNRKRNISKKWIAITALIALCMCLAFFAFGGREFFLDEEDTYKSEESGERLVFLDENQKKEAAYNLLKEYCESQSIDWREARNHVGEQVMVGGRIVYADYEVNDVDRTVYLDIAQSADDEDYFTIAILEEGQKSLDMTGGEICETYYGGEAYAQGIVQMDTGHASIVVSSADDIILLEPEE